VIPFAISFPFAALLLGLHGVAALLALGFVQVAFTIGGGLAALAGYNRIRLPAFRFSIWI